jgi:hypothetical protein
MAQRSRSSAHQHIVSFCGEPGCRDAPYHANTEDLVSPILEVAAVAAYFGEKAGEGGSDEYVVLACAGGRACLNTDPFWLYLRPDDPLMARLRPGHYDPGYFRGHTKLNSTWARLTHSTEQVWPLSPGQPYPTG